jgi:hypothetical protein
MNTEIAWRCISDFIEKVPNVLPEHTSDSEDMLRENIELLSKLLFDTRYTICIIKTCRPILIELVSKTLDNERMGLEIHQVAAAAALLIPLAPQLLDTIVKFFLNNRRYVDQFGFLCTKNDSGSTKQLLTLLSTIFGKIMIQYIHII